MGTRRQAVDVNDPSRGTAGRSRGRSARRSVYSAVERTRESSSNLPGTSCRNGTRVRAPPPPPLPEAERGRSRQRYTPLVRLRVPVSWISVQALIIARWYYKLLITYRKSGDERILAKAAARSPVRSPDPVYQASRYSRRLPTVAYHQPIRDNHSTGAPSSPRVGLSERRSDRTDLDVGLPERGRPRPGGRDHPTGDR